MIRRPAVFVVAALFLLAFAAAAGCAASLSPEQTLGKLIFFDTSLSTPTGQACADCHGPDAGWTGPDEAINIAGAVYEGAVPGRYGNRKPPSSAYASFSPTFYYDETAGAFVGGQFWDGRAATLVDQAKGPFLNPLEQNNPSAKTVCQKVSRSGYEALFESVFGPGSLDYISDVDAVYTRIATAIAAFEASPESNQFTSKYDYYLAGKATLSTQEANGLALFNGKAKCAGCHPSTAGPYADKPLFTDYTYDNLGTPKNPDNPFYSMPRKWNPLGADWVDLGLGGFLATTDQWKDLAEENYGKMKVPTLRNVDLRPSPDFVKAYSHNGYFKSLKEIVHFYNTRDVDDWPAPEVSENVNTTELGNLGLTDQEENDIVAFLKTLSDGYVPPNP